MNLALLSLYSRLCTFLGGVSWMTSGLSFASTDIGEGLSPGHQHLLTAACHSFNEELGGFLPDVSTKKLMQSLRTLGLPLCLPRVLGPRF